MSSFLRPNISPNSASTSVLSPFLTDQSFTPQRSSSSSSQSSTASIPARPIKPPPIETRTKASTGEQVWGADSLRQAIIASNTRNAGAQYAPLSPTHEEGLDPPGPPFQTAKKDNSGFIVHGGRRGSSVDGTNGIVKRAASITPRPSSASSPIDVPVGVTSFKFGEELGRGSFSVVRQATHLLTSAQYAIKILDKHHLRTHKKEKYAQVEVEALKRLSTSSPSSATTRSAGPLKNNAPGKRLVKSASEQTVMDLPSRPPSANTAGERLKDVEKGKEKGRGGHPGVIKMFWAFQDVSSLYFVLDLAPNGELLSLIRKNGSLSIPSARQYAAELVDVVDWMHGRGVLHRDLKPENILLDADHHIRLTDFGSAKVFPLQDGKISPDQLAPPTPLSEPSTPLSSSSGRGQPKRSFVGTAEYVSPEVLLNEPASESSDFWAIGCILYQCIAGEPPFRGKTEYLTFQKIKALDYEFPAGFDGDARDLVERLLVLEPTQRLGMGPSRMQDIKSHPFFSSVNFSTLWMTAVPELASGLVGPPPPPSIRSDEFFGVFDSTNSESEDSMDGELENGPAGKGEWEPPRGSWYRPSNHAGSGSVSSGKSVATLDPASVVGQAFGALGLGRPVSVQMEGRNSTEQRPAPETPKKETERSRAVSGPWISPSGKDKRCLPLLPDETLIFSSRVLVPASQPIAKTLSKPKERWLVLTDFPRLLCVKLDSKGTGTFKTKYECLISRRGSESVVGAGVAGGANVLKGVKEKGGRGFSVQTSLNSSRIFLCEDSSLRQQWLDELKMIQE